MARLRSNNVFGTTTDAPLLVGATTVNSAGLANLVAVAGTDTAVITLDPNRVNGAPEIVIVTAHTGSATSATITRGAEGTTARQHPAGTFWVHAATRLDFPNAMCRVHHSVNQPIAHNTLVALAFDTERYDTDSMHNTVTNNSRITFNTAGVYTGFANVRFVTRSDYTAIDVQIRFNGTTVIGWARQIHAGANVIPIVTVPFMTLFAVGDYVEALVRHVNAAAVVANVEVASAYSPEFAATWVGAAA